jgi:hypothetical protein
MLKGILKSKCKTIEFCGIKCERDIEAETKIEMSPNSFNHESPTARL